MRLALAASLALLAASCQDSGPAALDAAAVEANNRGVGLMGRFDYDGAHAAFADLAVRYPQQPDIQVNLAVATLNRQQPGDEAAALTLLERVLGAHPDHLRARFLSGILLLNAGDPERAAEHFQAVARADPGDAYAAYFLGQCLAQQGRAEDALSLYERAAGADPYLRSAYYGAFTAAQRLGRRDKALQELDRYRALDNNPRAHLAEIKYTRMGPKAEAVTIDAPTPAPAPTPEGPLFEEPITLEAAAPGALSITTADIDGDGDADLYVARGREAAAVLLGAAGAFRAAPDHPLAAAGVNAALWGDVDNDGRSDVYLLGDGGNRLLMNRGGGTWEDVTARSGTAGGGGNAVDGSMLDADHDGDLDLLWVDDTGVHLLSNNLDGSFRALPLPEAPAAARRVLAGDLDGDRDADLLALREGAPNAGWLNDRLWAYHALPADHPLVSTGLEAAAGGDLDADGRMEVYGIDGGGTVTRIARTQNGWTHTTLGRIAPARAPRLALSDIDGDGQTELLAASGDGIAVLRVDGNGVQETLRLQAPGGRALQAWTTAVLDPAHGPALAAVAGDGAVLLWRPGPGRYAYAALDLTGKDDSAESMRSNASGIGTRVAVRVGSRWTATDTFRRDSGPGQGLQPLAVGLGGAARADFVAIEWSDGVFQTELDLDAGGLHRIAETQRQLSSCPVLFAWDGEGYAFVSDLLGVGGVGYLLAPGEYAPPRPRENFLFPAGMPVADGGRYRVKIGEPMEEAAYLDAARLVVYDLPAGWDVVLDERMDTGAPEATGMPRFFRDEALPVRALNDRGEDVTRAVVRVDGHAAPVGALDGRFIGRLAGEHVLTLEFGTALDARGEAMLVADGWVEYPYSQTMFAAWQAGAALQPPTLEARGADGTWRTLLPAFGYPAGMPRRMSVPLRGLPPGTRALRLRTNQEIYWDRIAVAWAEAPPELHAVRMPLLEAHVAASGFAARTTGAQRLPHYDYSRRSPLWDARHMAGHYTAFGPALELVDHVDDAVAVIGPGEEVHLEFEAPPAPPPGWRRRVVLETNGWAKDMDLYTQNGETVGPLPSTGKPAAARDRLHAKYNTRYRSGY
jgi:tetratricopeptide (TPR) repeat protein